MVLFAALSAAILSSSVFAQKAKPTPAVKPAKPIIFAVLENGTYVEPIAYVTNEKLEPAVNGSDDRKIITAFNKTYYKPGKAYHMVFGGGDAGTVTIKSSDAKSECAANTARATSKSAKVVLKGFVMALATNATIKNKAASFRRKPTVTEKSEIDALVKKEFLKHKLTPATLRYHNLTAIDVEADGKPEFVGSYWVEIDKLTRALLFFIADKSNDGKYSFGYSEYRTIDQANVMSGEIKAVDDGVYHELLLDTFDYTGDGKGEIFTYVQSFEGAGFNAYRRSGGKWVKSFEGSNYHCGY